MITCPVEKELIRLRTIEYIQVVVVFRMKLLSYIIEILQWNLHGKQVDFFCLGFSVYS